MTNAHRSIVCRSTRNYDAMIIKGKDKNHEHPRVGGWVGGRSCCSRALALLTHSLAYNSFTIKNNNGHETVFK